MFSGFMKVFRKGRKRMVFYELEELKFVMVDNSFLGNVLDFFIF